MGAEHVETQSGDWLFPNGENVDLFDAWAFAAAEAHLALQSWQLADPAERGDAYAVYRAALDREEQAANVLAARMPRRSRFKWLPVPTG